MPIAYDRNTTITMRLEVNYLLIAQPKLKCSTVCRHGLSKQMSNGMRQTLANIGPPGPPPGACMRLEIRCIRLEVGSKK